MSMREQMVQILEGPGAMCRMSHDEACMVVDELFCALLKPTLAMCREANLPYAKDGALNPSHGIPSAGQLPSWHVIQCGYEAMITAARDGK